MGAGRKTQTLTLPPTQDLSPYSVDVRGLQKNELGGVIFMCSNGTMKECESKQLFGLPASHIIYVKNISIGLPLFLYNFDEKRLYGIYEATGDGEMNINRRGWTNDGSGRTRFPAQVRMRVRQKCSPLLESQFKPVIEENYFARHKFMFELDHKQTGEVIALFASVTCGPSKQVPSSTVYRKVKVLPGLPSPKTNTSSEGEKLVSTTTVPQIPVNPMNLEADFPALLSHAGKKKAKSYKPLTLGAGHWNTSLKLSSTNPVVQSTVKRETEYPALSSCTKINEPECLYQCTSEPEHLNSLSLKLTSTSSAPRDSVRVESDSLDYHSRNSIAEPERFEVLKPLNRNELKLDSCPLFGTYSPFQAQPDGGKAEQEDLHLITTKPKKLALKSNSASEYHQNMPLSGEGGEKSVASPPSSSDRKSSESSCYWSAMSPGSMFYQPIIAQLVQDVQELKAFRDAQTRKMGRLEDMLVQAQHEIRELKSLHVENNQSTPSLAHIAEQCIE